MIFIRSFAQIYNRVTRYKLLAWSRICGYLLIWTKCLAGKTALQKTKSYARDIAYELLMVWLIVPAFNRNLQLIICDHPDVAKWQNLWAPSAQEEIWWRLKSNIILRVSDCNVTCHHRLISVLRRRQFPLFASQTSIVHHLKKMRLYPVYLWLNQVFML